MSFLQSRGWEEIQKRDGREAHRLVYGNESAVFFKHKLPLGLFYWYAPRPEIKNADAFLKALIELPDKPVFIRVEPLNELPAAGCRLPAWSASNSQPRETILINLSQDEDELLSAMHPKTRYNIRLAERHGVMVEERGAEAIEEFYAILAETAKRDNFHLHTKPHYEHLLFSNSQEFENRLFFAMHGGEIAAAALVNFYRGTATYLHGASNYAIRNVMAPYLLHWGIIKEAKRRGIHTYDFGGVDEARWPGVTRFKHGFGGREEVFPQAFDVISHPLRYAAYKTGAYLTNLIK